MTQLKVEKQVNVSKDKAWRYLADYAGIASFNPFVKKSYPLNDQRTGLGAERKCELNADGSEYIVERAAEWHEGQGYVSEAIGGSNPPPVKGLKASFLVEAMGEQRSLVSMTFSYQPKFGLLGQLMNVLMVKRLLRKAAEGTLEGFKFHTEQGGKEVTSLTALRASVSA